ncbi:MAG: group I intron-associated PD-(D/E)XK endonuclease [Microscillaceae bacterium]|jgi:hypothetical protein|nr:group I intron-associated PD-(D/E)XK endonuclease [Microscillaceae bacterium]
MSKKYNQYLGKAGHLVVMSEFLIRGWNVAIPEVDVGDYIFVVEDKNGVFRRVQVKTSSATIRKKGFSAQFQISLKQLQTLTPVLVHYVFIARLENSWTSPLIISQDILFGYYENQQMGTLHNEYLNLYFTWENNQINCSKLDFTKHLEDYSDFPIIYH